MTDSPFEYARSPALPVCLSGGCAAPCRYTCRRCVHDGARTRTGLLPARRTPHSLGTRRLGGLEILSWPSEGVRQRAGRQRQTLAFRHQVPVGVMAKRHTKRPATSLVGSLVGTQALSSFPRPLRLHLRRQYRHWVRPFWCCCGMRHCHPACEVFTRRLYYILLDIVITTSRGYLVRSSPTFALPVRWTP